MLRFSDRTESWSQEFLEISAGRSSGYFSKCAVCIKNWAECSRILDRILIFSFREVWDTGCFGSPKRAFHDYLGSGHHEV